MRRLLLAALLTVSVLGLALAVAVAASPSTFFSVSGPRLAHSLHKAVPGGAMGVCWQEPGGAWQCSVQAGSRRGWAKYRIRLGADNCWTGRLMSPHNFEGEMPARADGCVSVRDVLRVMERLEGDPNG